MNKISSKIFINRKKHFLEDKLLPFMRSGLIRFDVFFLFIKNVIEFLFIHMDIKRNEKPSQIRYTFKFIIMALPKIQIMLDIYWKGQRPFCCCLSSVVP